MKKMPILLIVLIVAYLFVPNIVNAEPELQWEKTYGGTNSDEGYCVQQTFDGGYIIAGNTYSSDSESYDILLIKTDSTGNSQWEKTFSATFDDFARSVQQTSDGGYIIAGRTEPFGFDNGADVYIIKTDSSGNSQWEQTFGGNDWEYGESIQQTSDGGYIIAGCTYSYGTGGDVYLIKIDGNGNSQWEKTYGGSDFDFGSSVQQTSDGGYIITGYTRSYGSGELDVYLIKTNGAGTRQWHKTFGGNDWDCGESVRQTSDDGYIITGYTYSDGAGMSDIYLIKTDDSGNSEWERTFGADYSDKGYCVQQTTDGGYIVAGHTLSYGSGGTDVYLIKTNSFGDTQWEKTFGGSNWDYGESIQQTFDGGFIIVGYTYSYGAGNSDVYLIKLSADPTAGKTIYVDYDIPLGSNNGSSWVEAYPCLQNALDDAEFGDMICVAGGIYRPDQMFSTRGRGPQITASGEREATFQMKNGVRIIGGYAGFGEPDPNARDIELYETILSGDLIGDDVEVIDPRDLPTEPTRTENSYHVVTSSGTNETAVLDGFTITAGDANGIDNHSNGGGLLNIFGSPTISNCRFIENTGTWRAGLYNYDRSNPIISNCEFRKNSSRTGSAIGNEEDCSPEITNCTFIQNYASTHGSGAVINQQSNPTIINCIFSQNYAGGNGGALENINGSNSTIISCDFTDNSTDSYGGAVFNAHESLPTFVNCSFSGNTASSGGGMHNTNSSPILSNCTFIGNSANDECGGMLNTDNSSPTLTNCTFSENTGVDEGGGMLNRGYSNPTLSNCIFSENSAGYGGGILNEGNNYPTLINCTIFGNSSEEYGGGISNSDNSHSTVINCIFWGNTALEGAQIYDGQDSSTTVSYSDVQHRGRSTWPGEGNIKTDPLFADPDNGDYHLKSSSGRWDPNSQSWVLDDVNSPCIDSGDPNSPIGDEPIPNGGRINMGAYGGTSQASLSQLTLSEMKASDPYPYDAAVGVEINPTLSWSSGATAVAHDVYFNTNYNNANNATITNPRDILVSQEQTSNSYSPGILSYNRTYYWRVDEVDEQNNRTKGDIWLFVTTDGGVKGRACFLPNTPIWVDGGFVSISEVAAGQTAGVSNTAIVEKLQEHVGMFDCRDIILENGNYISVVESHYFLLESGIWIASQNLKSGMKLKTMNGSITIKSLIKREMSYVGKVYNVKVSGTHQYMVGEDAVIVRDY